MDITVENGVTSTTQDPLNDKSFDVPFISMDVKSEFIPEVEGEIGDVNIAGNFFQIDQSGNREVKTEQSDFQSEIIGSAVDDGHFVSCGLVVKKEENMKGEKIVDAGNNSPEVLAELEPEGNDEELPTDENFGNGFNTSTSPSEAIPNSQSTESDSDISIVYEKDFLLENTHSGERPISNDSSVFKESSDQVSSRSSHSTETKQPGSESDQNVVTLDDDRPFKCEPCSRTFKSKCSFRVHLVSHRRFSCSVCSLVFLHKSHLERHSKTHSKEWPFSCRECGGMYKVKRELKHHLLSHLKTKPFLCPVCCRMFKSKSGLMGHVATHMNENSPSSVQCSPVSKTKAIVFECADCDAAFQTKLSLRQHLVIHSREKPFACTKRQTFKKIYNGDSHSSQHSSKNSTVSQDCPEILTDSHLNRPFPCSECTKTYNSKRDLKTHLRRAHFTCSQCNRTLTTKQNLERHLAVHSTDRPYKCIHCNSTFKYRTTLDEHLLIHTEEKPFKCSMCPLKFKSKLRLRSHLTSHLPEMPIKCTFCDSRFKSKLGFKLHSAMHLNEKLFSCERCSALLKLDALLDEQSIAVSGSRSRLFPCEHCSAKFKSELTYRLHSAVHLKAELCDSCAFFI